MQMNLVGWAQSVGVLVEEEFISVRMALLEGRKVKALRTDRPTDSRTHAHMGSLRRD